MRPLDWTPAFAGETNLRHCSFPSFRRKPESSGINEEFDVHTIMALLVRKQFYENIEAECITLGKMIGALIKKRKAIEEDR